MDTLVFQRQGKDNGFFCNQAIPLKKICGMCFILYVAVYQYIKPIMVVVKVSFKLLFLHCINQIMRDYLHNIQQMKGKVVIITGASSGIGKAMAIEFASKGASLVLAARRTELLENLKMSLPNAEVWVVPTDVSRESDCKQLIEETIQHFGKIDVLINNAGLSMRSLFKDFDLDSFKRLMDVNFYGTVFCTKYALPHLLSTKGSLVGIISIAGHVGLPARTAYSASKFAMRGFLDTIRIEHLQDGLHVLVAAPGFTASEVRLSALDARGLPQGETPRNEEKMMTAEECAKKIVQAVIQRKRSLVMTFVEGKLTVFLGKFFPSLLDRLTFQHMSKEPDSPLKRN
ncbi:MAG: SDR family oxidoreductase [Marinilabiliales bacterium]|nr:SDR family oxidoreductase [Marinilabiliales bacterium]